MTLASNTARMAGLSDSPLYGQNSLDLALSRAWPGSLASRFKQGKIGLDLALHLFAHKLAKKFTGVAIVGLHLAADKLSHSHGERNIHGIHVHTSSIHLMP